MSSDSLFAPLPSLTLPSVAITFNGQPLQVPQATTVAAALLAAGVQRFRRSPVSGADRAPYCMMGVCHDCLLEIDGVPDRQGCLTPLRAGMQIREQISLPEMTNDGHDLTHVMEAGHGR